MTDSYYLSDVAYDYLSKMAVEQNYVAEGVLHRVGISQFVERLSYRKYIDTRPDDIKLLDERLLASKRIPMWNTEEYRTSRTFRLSEGALTRFAITALSHRMTLGPAYKCGPYWKSLPSIAAWVLEAIGVEWLTPTEWPENVGPKKKHVARTKELVWE